MRRVQVTMPAPARRATYRAERGFALAALLLLVGAAAAAQPAADRSGSLLVFPDVRFAETDTVIEIANTSNQTVDARCIYVDGTSWQQTDFDLFLTAQQSTHWVVSRGRALDASDGVTGIDPGLVPPVLDGFHGFLICVQVDVTGVPFAANTLIGHATLSDVGGSGIAQYDAIGLTGFAGSENGDLVLDLGGAAAEYDACPRSWILNHFAEGAEDPVLGADSAVQTDLAVLACSQDFLTLERTSVTVQFLVTNEFEQRLSASTAVQGWSDLSLSDLGPIFAFDTLGTTVAQTRVSSVNGGVLLIGRELHTAAVPVSASTSVAWNAHHEGAFATGDQILLPPALAPLSLRPLPGELGSP